jgi:hypothetical protein
VRTPVATDPQRRAEALQIAAEHGAAEASRRTGVPAGTIRSWRARSGEAGPPAGTDPETWTERKARGAERSWEVAERATRKALQCLNDGDTLGAQRAMVTAGIAADKTGTLEEAAAHMHEREVRITHAQASHVLELLQRVFGDLGLASVATPGAPVAKLVAHYLRQGDVGKIEGSPSIAEMARDAVRRVFEPEIRRAIVAEQAAERLRAVEAYEPPPLALPAAGETEVRELEPLAAPRRVLRTDRVRHDRVEVVTGEVVVAAPSRGFSRWAGVNQSPMDCPPSRPGS